MYTLYLQTGEQLGELSEEREEDIGDEVGLGRGLGHLVPVHEGGHWKTLQLLRIALQEERADTWRPHD